MGVFYTPFKTEHSIFLLQYISQTAEMHVKNNLLLSTY